MRSAFGPGALTISRPSLSRSSLFVAPATPSSPFQGLRKAIAFLRPSS